MEGLQSISKNIPLPLWNTLTSQIKRLDIRQENPFMMENNVKYPFEKGTLKDLSWE
jgi:hypothetical protein